MNDAKTVISLFNLSPRRIGGVETMARELSRQLGNLGWQSVLCFKAEPAEEVRQFLSLPNVSIRSIDGMSRWSLTCQRQFRTLLKEFRPQIVHLNFIDFLSPYALVAKLAGVKRVYFTDHISRPADFTSRRASLSKRAAYRIGVPITQVLCVSNFVRRCWVDSEVLSADKLVTVYNGVDVARCDLFRNERSAFRRRHGIAKDAVVVSQISSMSLEKGVPTLLEAAQIVIASNPRVQFFLAGDGQRRPEFEKLAERLGLGARVRFIGLVDDPVKEGFFWASDVICQTSEWQEAFGLSITEAMACERPVIATRIGGIPEIIAHRESGILINRGDVNELAASILELASNPERCIQWGLAGRGICERRFDHRRHAAQTIEAYRVGPLK